MVFFFLDLQIVIKLHTKHITLAVTFSQVTTVEIILDEIPDQEDLPTLDFPPPKKMRYQKSWESVYELKGFFISNNLQYLRIHI